MSRNEVEPRIVRKLTEERVWWICMKLDNSEVLNAQKIHGTVED